jgi:hypothetical protein
MRRLILLTALSAFAVQPAIAGTDKPAKEKKICRSETPTGSIMMRTRCATAQEWADYDAANGRGAEHALGRDGVPGGNSPEKQYTPK